MYRLFCRMFGCCLLLPLSAFADPREVWLVGGGPEVFSSQAQIEANVLWARSVITGLPRERRLRTWFTDGSDPAPDVVEWAPPAEDPATLQPFARAGNSYVSNGERYRNHRVPDVVGTTEAARLTEDLGNLLRRVEPAHERWLIFNGHGQYADDLNNTIELWNNTWLARDDLTALFALAAPQARLRFVFAQCFSGAFTELATAGTERCGFVAEAADREAEGCSAAVDQAGWEDYSSHFFAALAGRDRYGRSLQAEPDLDADGRVTPLEAHRYTLVAADSADIPRSTSDALLEQWRPWWLPLAAALLSEADNVYADLARRVAAKAGITPGIDAAAELLRRRDQLQAQRAELENEQRRVGDEMANIREFMEAEMIRRWPRAGYAFTLNFKRFLEEDLDAAQAFLVAHPGYPELLQRERRYWALDADLLENERATSQLEKIEHLQGLARKLAVLRRFGPSALERRYEQLLACESAPF